MTKMEELVTMVKKAEAKAKEEKCCKTITTILAVIGVIVVVAAIAYAVYKFITKRKEEADIMDFEDFYEDEDEDSFIELEFVCPEDADTVVLDEDIIPAEAQEDEE